MYMNRPEITPENETLYDYYANRAPNKRLAKVGHWLLGAAIHPKITWDEEARQVAQMQLAEENPLLLAFNHILALDAVLPAVLLQREPLLRPMIGRSRILAKKHVFKNPRARCLFDGLGVIPTFRPKDNQEGDSLVSGLTNRLITAVARRLEYGEHIAGFPEGERNPEQPEKVKELRTGLFAAALQAENSAEIAPLVVGIAYAPGRFLGRIALHVGYCPPLSRDIESDRIVVQEHLQQAVTHANENLRAAAA